MISPSRRTVAPAGAALRSTSGSVAKAAEPGNGNGSSTEGNSLGSLLDLGTEAEAAGTAMADVKATPERVKRTTMRTLEQAEEKLDLAVKIDPAVVRSKILTSDFGSVQELATKEEADFAEALQALQEICRGMDLEFQKLVEPNEDEKAVVERAKNRVSTIEAAIAAKQASRNPFTTSFGQRARAITKFQQELEEARQGVTTAETQLQQMMRTRLMSAKMDASVTAYIQVSGKTTEIMKKRVTDVGEHVKMVQERQKDALDQKSEAAQMLKKFNGDLETEEAKLKVAESELTTLVNGTPDYATKEHEISDLRTKVEQVRGNRNVVLAKFESKEKFIQQLELSLHTLMSLRDSHKARIARLVSDTEERGATYKARLMAMKTMADQRFDETLDGIGKQLDRQTLEYMASVTVAANDALMKQFEAHPEKLKEQAVVMNTMAEHLADMRKRGAKVQTELQGRYGINPGDSSFFTYEGAETENTAPGNSGNPQGS